MTAFPQDNLKTSGKTQEEFVKKQMEAERMRDVLILLQNLTNNEEATIKLIVDCLYDVGSVNLIDQRLRVRPINRITKGIARMSKPAVRVIAWHWFKNNCPELIVKWLHSKVTFKYPENQPEAIVAEVAEIQSSSPTQIERLNRENKYLRHQVRWLTGISVVAIAALGVSVTWLNHNPELVPLKLEQRMQSANSQRE